MITKSTKSGTYHGNSCGWIGKELISSDSLMRPRKNGRPSDRPILSRKNSVRCQERGLVSRSASWSVVWTCWTLRIFFATKSLTNWISICICFILECWTGLKLRCVAPKLSHRSRGGCDRQNFSFWSRDSNHHSHQQPLPRFYIQLQLTIVR